MMSLIWLNGDGNLTPILSHGDRLVSHRCVSNTTQLVGDSLNALLFIDSGQNHSRHACFESLSFGTKVLLNSEPGSKP